MSIITERVKALCALRNVSISKLERGIGCANGTIRNWFERDSYPKIDNLISVADFLDTTVAYIIGETDNPRKGKLIVDGTSNIWDYLLPLTRVDTSRINKRMEKLRELFIDDLISKEVYAAEYRSLEKQLEMPLNAPKTISVDGVEEMLQKYHELSKASQKALWGRIVKRIERDCDGNIFLTV